ncbi:MAG: hypothetical protein OEW58_00830 [Gammaproteobacteria bacterium]|nr:hypothetical protein [Gammaproteobacteria bacterium]
MKPIKTLTATFALLAFSSAGAVEQVSVSHRVVATGNHGVYSSITLALTVSNVGSSDLHNVKIYPGGDEFALDERNQAVNVGYLPAMGQTVLYLTADTPLAKEYFSSQLPVLFLLNGKLPGDKNIELPLHSQGGNQ